MHFEGDKMILLQVKELLKLQLNLEEEGMKQEDKFMLGVIVTKLPPGWIKFKMDMYHKKMKI